LLVNPDNGRRHVGRVDIAHKVIGSPNNTNYFRIEGPAGAVLDPVDGDNIIETDLFAVTGKLADVIPPTITVLGANPAAIALNTPYTDAGATADDNIDGNITSRIHIDNQVDSTATGTYAVIYNVADQVGNQATATRTVMVVDSLPAAPTTTSLILSPETLDLHINADRSLSLAALDQIGSQILPAPTADWQSSDPAIASVDQTGLVTGHSAGTAIISAQINGITATSTITVSADAPAPQLSSIAVTPAQLTLLNGQTTTFSASAFDQNSQPMAATVAWSSSNSAIASIDQTTGLATAHAAGTVTITAASGQVSNTATLTVLQPTKLGFIVNPATSSIIGLPFPVQPTVAIQDAQGQKVSITSGLVSLSAYSDPFCSLPAFGTLNGTTAVAAPNGVATFAGLSYTGLGQVYLKATSGTLNAACSDAIQVMPVPLSINHAPQLTATAPQTINVDKDLRFVISATDPDNDQLTFSLINPPAGAAVDAVKGEFRWRPAAAGNFDIGLQVSDGRGGVATTTLAITVLSPAAAFVPGLGGALPVNQITAVNVPLTIKKDQTGRADLALANGNLVQLSVPIGAVKAPTTFRAAAGSLTPQNTPALTTGAIMVGNQIFNITATDPNNRPVRTFTAPLQITLTVAGLPALTADLGVYYFDEQTQLWTLVPNAVFNSQTSQVSFSVNHLTNFAVFNASKLPNTIKVTGDNKRVLGTKVYAKGTLLRTPDKRIYEVTANGLRHIRTLAELHRMTGRKTIKLDAEFNPAH
jgi:hypothetical protein